MKRIRFPFLKRIDAEIVDLVRTPQGRDDIRRTIALQTLLSVKRSNGGHFVNWLPVDISEDLYESVWREYHLNRILPIATAEEQRFIGELRRRKEVQDAELLRLVSQR